MSTTRSDPGAGDVATGSWASESLPLSVRKELLERELRTLGIRKAQAQRGAAAEAASSAQQQGQSSQHPHAGSSGPSETHAD